jgi:hypothetical protein
MLPISAAKILKFADTGKDVWLNYTDSVWKCTFSCQSRGWWGTERDIKKAGSDPSFFIYL